MKREGLRRAALPAALGVLLALSLAGNAVQGAQNRALRLREAMQRQRELADIVAAMADIEINLEKLLIASGAAQSMELLGETALLAQHVESGLTRLPLGEQAAPGAMKFAGQMGDYVTTLASRVSDGRMLTSEDERQLGDLLTTCRALGEQLSGAGGALAGDEALPREGILSGESEIPYPSLIYDGPFSDGRAGEKTLGLTGERLTRQAAREAAARYAGTTVDRVQDGADSGGRFEAFGFTARTEDGNLTVQVTGQGGHLLFMMPEQAQFAQNVPEETCLQNARVWLADRGFGPMEVCFVQRYSGMVVANFAAVQDGVLLYPDQVKVQVSMESGRVVGAECSQHLSNHAPRELPQPAHAQEEARERLSSRLTVRSARLCVVPQDEGERLCWGFEGTYSGATYWAFIDAETLEPVQLLRVIDTPDGQTAM